MYRPTKLEYFDSFIPPAVPVGPAKSELKIGTDGVLTEVKTYIFPIQGKSEASTITVT